MGNVKPKANKMPNHGELLRTGKVFRQDMATGAYVRYQCLSTHLLDYMGDRDIKSSGRRKGRGIGQSAALSLQLPTRAAF